MKAGHWLQLAAVALALTGFAVSVWARPEPTTVADSAWCVGLCECHESSMVRVTRTATGVDCQCMRVFDGG